MQDEVGGLKTTDTPYVERFAYDASLNLVYWGRAKIGTATSEGKWQIVKFTYDTNNMMTKKEWSGNGAFNQIWDNRTSLSYS